MVVPRHLFLLHCQSDPAACQRGVNLFHQSQSLEKQDLEVGGRSVLMMCIELLTSRIYLAKTQCHFMQDSRILNCSCSVAVAPAACLIVHSCVLTAGWWTRTGLKWQSHPRTQWLYNLIRLHYCFCRANPSIGVLPDHHPHHEGPSFSNQQTVKCVYSTMYNLCRWLKYTFEHLQYRKFQKRNIEFTNHIWQTIWFAECDCSSHISVLRFVENQPEIYSAQVVLFVCCCCCTCGTKWWLSISGSPFTNCNHMMIIVLWTCTCMSEDTTVL